MSDIAEIEVENDLDLGYEELPPIMVDKRFFVGERFDLLTQGNFILNSLSEASRKDTDGNDVIDLGYAHWVVALLCGSLSGVLERLNDNLTESEQKRLNLGDALAGLTAHLSSSRVTELSMDSSINLGNAIANQLAGLQDELLSHEEAASMLKIHPDTLSDWVTQGIVTPCKINGRKNLFSKLDLIAEIKKKKVVKELPALSTERFTTRKYSKA